jgi:hypothetical protein
MWVSLKLTRLIVFVACMALLLFSLKSASCWSNGGWSANPTDPDYGTHDWIAQHALDYLPAAEKQYLTDNLAAYLYGTELPDLPQNQGGIGDTTKHHVYYSTSGALVDDASAQRAQAEYTQALSFLENHEYINAAKAAGAMTHYIADLAVFGHVMGASTAWGTEVHHSDYEDYVKDRTTSDTSIFDSYLSFDGSLTTTSANDATVNLATDTTFGGANHLTCTWMDTNYDWSNPTFSGRCGESLNLAVNAVADVLHTLYVETESTVATNTPAPTPTPTAPEFPAPQIFAALMATVLAAALIYRKKLKEKTTKT